jgi:hypothetical protein
MIAQAGLLSYRMGFQTPIAKSTCTQRSFLLRPSRHLIVNQRTDSERTKCMLHGEPSVTYEPADIRQSFSIPMTVPGLLQLDSDVAGVRTREIMDGVDGWYARSSSK